MKTINNNLAILILLFIPLSFIAQNDNYVQANLKIETLDTSIINHVTSNSGKDFFDFFNQLNELYETTYPSDVTIIEKHSFDNQNTEIIIHSNDKLVYKFRTLAKKDYLYAAAQESVKRLQKFYLKNNGGIVAGKSFF